MSQAPTDTAADDAYCDQAAKRDDPDRWLAALFAPDARRPAIHALLAFAGELGRTRESVSQAMLGEIRLQWWRDALDGIAAGAPREHPVVRALGRAVAAYGLPRPLLDAMIDARTDDLYETPPAGQAALEAYARATGGALNRLILMVLGLNDTALAGAADVVGIAWALTGLARAVPAHAALRRVHLPADWLAEAGTDRDRFLLEPTAPAGRVAIRRLAALARSHLMAAATACPRPPSAARSAFLLAPLARLYLDRLEAAGFDPDDRRLAVGMPRRQLALVLAAWRGRL